VAGASTTSPTFLAISESISIGQNHLPNFQEFTDLTNIKTLLF
jgi:hypothetical protein